MAKGYDEHRARQDELQRFGRGLARRSGSSCELCADSGVPLAATEVTPLSEDPDPERCAFLCDACRDALTAKKLDDIDRWRCLTHTRWSEVAPVQVLAVRMLRRLDTLDVSWARENLEDLYIDPEIEAWIDDPREFDR
ncbi:MAG: phnA protein [Planctomycetota bacterium]